MTFLVSFQFLSLCKMVLSVFPHPRPMPMVKCHSVPGLTSSIRLGYQTKLFPVRIGHNRPRMAVFTDPSYFIAAKSDNPLDSAINIFDLEVEVITVFHCFHLEDFLKEQRRWSGMISHSGVGSISEEFFAAEDCSQKSTDRSRSLTSSTMAKKLPIRSGILLSAIGLSIVLSFGLFRADDAFRCSAVPNPQHVFEGKSYSPRVTFVTLARNVRRDHDIVEGSPHPFPGRCY